MRNLENLTFEIQESPVLYNHNGQILTSDTHKVISKDSGDCISVMKNSYFPMYNKDFSETVDRMIDISGFEFDGYSEIDNGRIIIANLKNGGGDFEINGDRIEDYLLLGSSFDGRYPFFIGTTTFNCWCKNQFSRITRMEKVRHTKSAPKRREELMMSLEAYFSNKRMIYKNLERMTRVKIDPALLQAAQDYVLGISKEDRLDATISTRKLNQLEILNRCVEVEMAHNGENMYSIFNGVTRYTTHEMNVKERSFGNVFGTAAEVNKRAYEFALMH